MRSIKTILTTVLLGLFLTLGCDSLTDSVSDENITLQSKEGITANAGHCHSTVTGLTANYLNEVPTESFDVTCDIGIFFDEDGTIDGVEIYGTVAAAKSVQFGIYVHEASVDVKNSQIFTEESYPHQFIPITYRDGATGTISDNSVEGNHRSGMVFRGSGTDVTVKGNDVIGIGPKVSGWAQNGIQFDNDATGTVSNNLVEGHWYDVSGAASSGLVIVGSNDITAHRNTFLNNEASIYVTPGNGNNFIHNTIEILFEESKVATPFGVILLYGDNNGVRQSSFTSAIGDELTGVGIYLVGNNNKLIRNNFSGWLYPYLDYGDETKIPKPFQYEDGYSISG